MKRKFAKWISYLTSVSLLFGSLDIAAVASGVDSEDSAYVVEDDVQGYYGTDAEATEVVIAGAETDAAVEGEADVIPGTEPSTEDGDTPLEEEASEEVEYIPDAAVYNEADEDLEVPEQEVFAADKLYTTQGQIKADIDSDTIDVIVKEDDDVLAIYMERYGEEVSFTAMPAEYVEGNDYTYTWYFYDTTTYESEQIYENAKTGEDAKSDTIDIGKFHDYSSGQYTCRITSGDYEESYNVIVCYVNSSLKLKVNGKELKPGYIYDEEDDYWHESYDNNIDLVITHEEDITLNIEAASTIDGADVIVAYEYYTPDGEDVRETADSSEIVIPYGVDYVYLKFRDGYSQATSYVYIEYLNVIEGTNQFVGGFPETIYYTEKSDNVYDENNEDYVIAKAHEAGYPIFSAISMPANQTEEFEDSELGYYLYVRGVDVSIDGGDSKFYDMYNGCLANYISTGGSGSDKCYNLFAFADCLELTEGEHTVAMTYYVETMESQLGETGKEEFYSYTVSDTVNFVKNAPDGDESTDTYITDYDTQYLTPGKSTYDYSYFERKAVDEVLDSMAIYVHSDSGEYGDPIFNTEITGYVYYASYAERGSIYSIDGIDMSLFANRLPGYTAAYYTCVNQDIGVLDSEQFDEDTYLDVVYTSNLGNRYIKRNALCAISPNTETTYIDAVVPTAGICLLGYDSTRDYIALTIYGYNVKESSIPAFYSDKEMTEGNKVAYFDPQDPECALEGGDFLGVHFITMKKVNPEADIWDNEAAFYYDVSDDTVICGSNSIYYYPGISLIYAVEGNGKGMRIRVSSAMADVGDTLKITYSSYSNEKSVTKSTSVKVKSDELGLYAELSNSDDVYKIWAVSDFGGFTVKNTKSSTSSKKGLTAYCFSDASYLAKTSDNLYVKGNHAWELHEFSKLGTPVYEGYSENTTDTVKAVLTEEQVKALADTGRVYRYCIRDDAGRIIETSTISFAEQLYRITLMDDGQEVGTVDIANKMSFTTIYNFSMEKPGYKFDGWYTKASGGDKISATKKFTSKKNMTLYAHWSPVKYAIVYDSNIDYMRSFNGSLKASGKTAKSTMTYGKAKKLSKNGYAISGYKFVGWNTRADGRGVSYAPGAEVKDLATREGGVEYLYAQWELVDYDIQYMNVSDVVFDYNMPNYPKTYNRSPETIYLPENMVREGYDFAGWYKDSKYKKKIDFISLDQAGTIKVYAKWKAHTYKVSFNSSVPDEDLELVGVTGTVKPVTMTYDKAKKLPENKFKITGYKFAGWDLEPFEGNGYNPETIIKDKASVKNLSTGEDITLYAQWELVSYKITYKNAVDGSNGVTNTNTTTYTLQDSYRGIQIEEPTREGYTFEGWYKDSKFKKPLGKTFTLEGGSTGNKTFYAKWKKN